MPTNKTQDVRPPWTSSPVNAKYGIVNHGCQEPTYNIDIVRTYGQILNLWPSGSCIAPDYHFLNQQTEQRDTNQAKHMFSYNTTHTDLSKSPETGAHTSYLHQHPNIARNIHSQL